MRACTAPNLWRARRQLPVVFALSICRAQCFWFRGAAFETSATSVCRMVAVEVMVWSRIVLVPQPPDLFRHVEKQRWRCRRLGLGQTRGPSDRRFLPSALGRFRRCSWALEHEVCHAKGSHKAGLRQRDGNGSDALISIIFGYRQGIL